MKTATVSLKSVSPYSQGKHVQTPRLDKESDEDYEKRTWRDKLHTDEKDNVFIPAAAFKNCLSECAKYLSIKIPGKGNSTYTKHFEAGVLVVENMPIKIEKKDVPGVWRFVPSDGRRGGSTRVSKCFPEIPAWEGSVSYLIFDDTVTKEIFEDVLRQAGMFIGIGVYRPRNNGTFGRFEISNIEWD